MVKLRNSVQKISFVVMNESGILHLKDENFNIAESREMQLLIKVASQRISYAIVSQKDNRLLVLYDAHISQSIETELHEISRTNTYLRSAFASVKMSVETSNFTLIPAPYFSKDDLPGYEKLAQANEGTKTFISTINSDAIKCVAALELEVTAPFISLFSQIQLFSQVNSLVEGGLKLAGDTSSRLVLQFNSASFEAFYSLDGKLLFYNLFPVTNADDFNYYLLSLIKQLNIECEKTSVHVAGDILEADDYYTRIEKYFEDIHFAHSSKLISSLDFKELKPYKYFSLLSLRLCE